MSTKKRNACLENGRAEDEAQGERVEVRLGGASCCSATFWMAMPSTQNVVKPLVFQSMQRNFSLPQG